MAVHNQMLNYSPIGMVSILMGIAVVEGPDGLTRFLQVGDELHVNDTVRVVGQGDAEITLLDGTRGSVQGGESLYLDLNQFNMDHVSETDGDFRVLRRDDVLVAESGEDLDTWLGPPAAIELDEGAVAAVGFDPLESGSVPEFGDYLLGLGCLMAETDQCFAITSVDEHECDQPTEFG